MQHLVSDSFLYRYTDGDLIYSPVSITPVEYYSPMSLTPGRDRKNHVYYSEFSKIRIEEFHAVGKGRKGRGREHWRGEGGKGEGEVEGAGSCQAEFLKDIN